MRTQFDYELVNKATNLLSILSKSDAFTIFLLARDGLKAETDMPQNIGLTKKRYYSRLKQLMEVGLIDKSGGVYKYTTLGTLVYQKHLLGLLEHVRNIKQLRMIDALKRASQFSEDEIANFVGKLTGLSIAASTTPQMTDATLAAPMHTSCRMMGSYEDMISTAIERINFAKSEILYASRFTNEMIINAMIRKANAGVDVRVIADTDLVMRFINSARDKLQIVDKNSLERLNVVGNPWYPAGNVQRKYVHIPFSLLIFDGKEASVEFVDAHDPDKLLGCMLVKEPMVCRELRAQFNKLWHVASDDLTQLLEMASQNNRAKIQISRPTNNPDVHR